MGEEQLQPEGNEAPGADHLRAEPSIVASEEEKGAIALSSRDAHAGKRVLTHLVEMSLCNVMTLMTGKAAPIDDSSCKIGPSLSRCRHT